MSVFELLRPDYLTLHCRVSYIFLWTLKYRKNLCSMTKKFFDPHPGRVSTTRPDKHGRVSWYLVKSDVYFLRYCTHVHWTSHFLQGTINTRPCLTGYPVPELPCLRILEYPAELESSQGRSQGTLPDHHPNV